VFVPNRLANTKEPRDGLQELRNVLKEEGRGRMAPGLSNRPAVYPPLLNGRKENFFTLPLDISFALFPHVGDTTSGEASRQYQLC
jgi:hypothetical protein